MKNILILFLILLTHNLWAVCSSPISRTNSGTNQVLTSTKYNLDLNTVYNKVNSLPGDCILNDSINGSKLIDATVTNAKLAANAVATSNIADGAITAAKLAAAIENLVPVGTILPYFGTAAPSGYLICNGQSVSRATYATLYAVIGNAAGTADGVSFNIPDLRGKFLRMVDGGAGSDPDRASRTALMTGGNVGDAIGSLQADQFKLHDHISGGPFASAARFLYSSQNNGAQTGAPGQTLANNATIYPYTSAVGGNQTNPVNVNVNYIIKY